MNQPGNSIWTTLEDANLVEGECPEAGELESPWYVKILLGFSGWLASLFLLGFVGIGFRFIIDSSFLSLIIGGLMIAGSYILLLRPKNEFIEHLTLAISLAGQILIVIGLFDIVGRNHDVAWLLIALVQAPLAIIMPNFLHRFFSSFAAIFSLSIAVSLHGASHIFSGIVMLLCAWIWLNEFHFPKHIRKMQAIGYGLTLALIEQKGLMLFGDVTQWMRSSRIYDGWWTMSWVGEVLGGAALLYVIWQLLDRAGHRISDRLSVFALLAVTVVTAVSIEAHGLTVGIMILLLGFSASNRVLQGLGIMSLVFYISTYYYFLQTTLLAKSQTLFVVGLALLVIRWLFVHLFVHIFDHKTKGGES